MPALAVTEHGNMFSSVVFHDAARKRGIKPILGCEVYVAPGGRRDKSGTIGETQITWCCSPRPTKGYKNLIKLVSSGYTEGFYYKPRIDKELLAQHAEGLIGLSSCLKGEVATEIRGEQAKRALAAAASYRDILGAGNFFLEMQFQGIDEQRIVNTGLVPIARDLNMPLVVHQRRALPAARRLQAARHPALHRHRQVGQRCAAAAVSRRSVLPQDRRRDGGDLRGLSRGAEEHRAHRRARQRRHPVGREPPAQFAVPEGFTLDGYFEHVARHGFAAARWRGCGSSTRKASCGRRSASTSSGSPYEIEMIKQMGFPATS